MTNTDTPGRPRTRLAFRVLAGIIAGFLLLVGLPIAAVDARTGSLAAFVGVACCLFGGIGMALGAFTGRWFNAPN